MHVDGGRIRFTPSDLAVFFASEFASWMDRWELERRRGRVQGLPVPVAGDGGSPAATDARASTETADLPLFAGSQSATPACEPDAEDDDAQILKRRGTEHERAVLATLQRDREVRLLHDVADPEATREALRGGAAVLYQAPLGDGEFTGRADFLVRRTGEDGRTWHEPAEAKLARSPKPEHVLQLCTYADLLAALQGTLPPEIEIVLGDGRRARLPTGRYVHYARRLRRAFIEFQRRFDPARLPHPGRSADHGRWSGCAERIIAATDHLRACAFIHRNHIRRLEQAGVTTLAELATLAGGDRGDRSVPGIRPPVLRRLAVQARLQVESRRTGRLHYEVRREPDLGERRGLVLLPPASHRDVYFDMEGHPLPDGQLEYLFGSVHEEDGEVRFRDIWATSRDAQRTAFETFVDWVHARWREDPSLHIYHYNAYEVAALERLMGLYGSRENEIDDLLRAGVFVDLYRVVRQGLVIGSQGYSLKDIEPLYQPSRSGKVRTAEGCMAAFERWLDAPDGATCEDSATLRDIRDYNRADCESTRELALWLRRVQRQAGIEPAPPPAVAGDPPAETPEAPARRAASPSRAERAAAEKRAREALAARLLAMSEAAGRDHEDGRIATLLAHLLEFHWREAKPVYWRKYERHAMSEEELYDDPEAIAGCQRLSEAPLLLPGGPVFEYAFDADQDTKLAPGDSCAVAGMERSKAEIADLDADAGRVRLRFGAGVGAAPEQMSIFLDDFVPDDPLRAAVARYAAAWSEGQRVVPAIDDFLRRRPPRIAGHTSGAIVAAGEPLVPALARAIGGLQESTLCIQGPPGSGKTYNAAEVVLGLLERGCRVGIMANGHKAILNLLAEVAGHARRGGALPCLVKVKGDAEDPRLAEGGIRYVPENKDGGREIERQERDGSPAGCLPGIAIGATAWCFARPEMQGRLDYLFVDEAGQVSVANLVAAGMAARSIVLVGDQMQLGQPLQGSHPGESGQSALEYLLCGQATIPDDFGVFLGVTHRMHPDVCEFVSQAVYDGKLHPDRRAARRRIVPGPARRGASRRLQRGTGIVWVPVEHHDNAQASDEEVQAIVEITGELLRAAYHDGESPERALRLDDILFVAPYNMQVRRLERRLQQQFGGAPQVGSVDRFQGLQAPAVVVSMCASTFDDVPRGLEFLLSPNRINVAISRAQCLAVVVGSPAILASRCRSLEDMERLDLYCRLVEHAERQDSRLGGASTCRSS